MVLSDTYFNNWSKTYCWFVIHIHGNIFHSTNFQRRKFIMKHKFIIYTQSMRHLYWSFVRIVQAKFNTNKYCLVEADVYVVMFLLMNNLYSPILHVESNNLKFKLLSTLNINCFFCLKKHLLCAINLFELLFKCAQ